jgi:hypothetical protein
MTAAALAPAPLSQEALTFWEDLSAECKRYTAATNTSLASSGLPADQLLRCTDDGDLHVLKSAPPSTSVQLALNFFSWGPVIRGRVTGRETDQAAFCQEEWEVPIAKDLDGAVVAIFGEGRSFSPQDLARYLMQAFRRCYPAVVLPCEFPSVL